MLSPSLQRFMINLVVKLLQLYLNAYGINKLVSVAHSDCFKIHLNEQRYMGSICIYYQVERIVRLENIRK